MIKPQKILSNLYERLGFNFLYQGDYARAEKWFRRLEASEPDSVRVLRDLGLLLMSRGDSAGAKALLLKEEKLYGPSFHRHSSLADIAYAEGSRKEAARRYGLALAEPEAAPDGEMAAWRGLLEARLALCATEASFARGRESMERYREGEAARAKGQAEAAMAAFEAAAALDPTNWSALNNAGSIAFDLLKDAARAEELFSRALRIGRSPQVARNLELARKALSARR